jgi:type II secretory pathway pseudopilin PulG
LQKVIKIGKSFLRGLSSLTILRRQKIQKLSGGFTLAELLVSVFIIVIITSVVAFNQKDFTDQIALSNSASEIELDLRQAQTYGISVKELTPGIGDFDIAYGMRFDIISSGSNTSYISFADKGVKNGRYDGSSELIDVNTITKGNKINRLCAIDSGWNYVCTGNFTYNVQRIDVTYKRPNPNAIFVFYNTGGNVITGFLNHRGAAIELVSPKGITKTVHLFVTGEISIQ